MIMFLFKLGFLLVGAVFVFSWGMTFILAIGAWIIMMCVWVFEWIRDFIIDIFCKE